MDNSGRNSISILPSALSIRHRHLESICGELTINSSCLGLGRHGHVHIIPSGSFILMDHCHQPFSKIRSPFVVLNHLDLSKFIQPQVSYLIDQYEIYHHSHRSYSSGLWPSCPWSTSDHCLQRHFWQRSMLRDQCPWRCRSELCKSYVMIPHRSNVDQCFLTNVYAITNLDHIAPSTPTSVDDFVTICANIGQQAQCCVLPILGQALLCEPPVGAA